MGYHAGVSWLPGGLLGVDVFFVLSGFLITSLLLTEYNRTGRVSLIHFWGRRARRLLPAMAILLASMIAWAAFVATPATRASLRGDAFSTLLYVANWRFIFSGQGYFDHFAPQSPLLHTWSVSVEEQFYLIWPLLMLLVLRWRRRGVFALAVVGASASAILMLVLSLHGTSPDRLYYGTDTRALPLLLGCALAALRPPDGIVAAVSKRGGSRTILATQVALAITGLLGAGGLIYCWLEVADRTTWLYRGGFAVVAAAAAAVLISCSDSPRGPVARFLSFRPLRWIGAISYGLYLYHWPLFQLLTHARTHLTGPGLLGVRFAATFVVATLSYYLVEQPIRRGALSRKTLTTRLPGKTKAAAGIFLPVTSILVVAGLVLGMTLTTTGSADATPVVADGGGSQALPETQPPPPKAAPLTSAQRAVLSRPIRVLVEGDSLAFTLAPGLADAGPKFNYQVFNLGLLGCGVARGGPIIDGRGQTNPNANCEIWPAIRASDVRTYDPDVSVLLTGRWEVLDRYHDGQWMHVGEPAYDAYLSNELDLAINVLSKGGAKVLLLTTPCFAPQEQPDGSIFSFDDPARLNRYNALVRAAAARHPGTAAIADVDALLCPGGKYTPTINGVQVRNSDGIHLTEAGGLYVAERIGRQIVSLGSVRRTAQAKATTANQSHAD